MNRQIIQDSLDFIEDNLQCDLTAQELGQRAGFSLFHYYRLFQAATGLPVMQYIQRRRLLHAIYDISCGQKMIDCALCYGFDTHAGFYKAFLREFGCTPTSYRRRHKVQRPYRINLFQEDHIMISHKKASAILSHWGLSEAPITDVIHEGSGLRNDSALYVGTDYVLKFSPNLGRLQNHLLISKALADVGISTATAIPTPEGENYVAEGELYFCLTRRLHGTPILSASLYEGDSAEKARFIGEIIGQFSLALATLSLPGDTADLYGSVTQWAIPALRERMNLPDALIREYRTVFGALVPDLPVQLIHRDPNPGNIILCGTTWGLIDFELSERNLRIFDPCYAATAILSESFDENSQHLSRWLVIYRHLLDGYDAVAHLSAAECRAVPYVLLSNQLLALAWFAGKEKYQEVYETNRRMTEWLIAHFDLLRLDEN